jgi:hypothetical protein
MEPALYSEKLTFTNQTTRHENSEKHFHRYQHRRENLKSDKFPIFYGNLRYITVFTRGLSWAK